MYIMRFYMFRIFKMSFRNVWRILKGFWVAIIYVMFVRTSSSIYFIELFVPQDSTFALQEVCISHLHSKSWWVLRLLSIERAWVSSFYVFWAAEFVDWFAFPDTWEHEFEYLEQWWKTWRWILLAWWVAESCFRKWCDEFVGWSEKWFGAV